MITHHMKRAWEALHYRLIRKPFGGGKPVPAAALDREYRSGAWDHFWGDHEKERHLALVQLIVDTPGNFSLLDMGCGSGRLASMLPPSRLEDYLGVDLSKEGLARARSLNLPHGKFLEADYERWTPEGVWDVIAFNESLGYAPDPAATATRFARHLHPQGRLIISHYRWGNHAAFWKRLSKQFQCTLEQTATNAKGQIWDLRVLQPLRS